METAVGIFATHFEAQAAVRGLLSSGVPSKNINVLTPGDWEGHIAQVPTYRCGFEAAQRPECAGKSFDDAREVLRRAYLDRWENQAFRRGYERGQKLRERNRAREAELAAR